MDPTDKEARDAALDELLSQSDRGCAIVGASIIESLLERLLRDSMIQEVNPDIFTAYGPLGSLRAKIDLAHALGLLDATSTKDLHRIRKIRNAFAHSLTLSSLGDSPACEHVREILFSRSIITKLPTSARVDFQSAVAVQMGFLQAAIGRAQRPEVAPALPLDCVASIVDAAADLSPDARNYAGPTVT